MDSWKEMDKIALRYTCLGIYHDLSEETRALITFPKVCILEKSLVGAKRIHMGSS
jgi:hypothetical protein